MNPEDCLPIDSHIFETISKGSWKAELTGAHCFAEHDQLLYEVTFHEIDSSRVRHLKFWLHLFDLEVYRCQDEVIAKLGEWLEWKDGDAELWLTLDTSNRQVRVEETSIVYEQMSDSPDQRS